MTTTKSIIVSPIPTTNTQVYLNNSGKGAVLKSLNINSIVDSSLKNKTESSTESEWSFIGSNINPLVSASASTGTGFGVPYPIQLSNNRVLLISLPHFQHQGGALDYFSGNLLHTQIVEYRQDPITQDSRYVCGPIVNIALADAPFTSSTYSLWSLPNSMTSAYGQSCFKGFAINQNTVIFAYRINGLFRLYRLKIDPNTNYVNNITVANYNLGNDFTTAVGSTYAFDICKFPGSTSDQTVTNNTSIHKIVVLASTGGGTLSASTYAIDDTPNTIIKTGTISTSITPSSWTLPLTIAPLYAKTTSNTANFTVAAATSITSISIGNITIEHKSSTTLSDTGSSATPATYTISSNCYGLEAACVSSSATDANSVVALINAGATSYTTFFKQTSTTPSTSNPINVTSQHTSAKGIYCHFNWGDTKSVFIGESQELVVWDAGTANGYNLISSTTDSTNTDRAQLQWFPFNDRPIYTFYDSNNTNKNRVCQYYSRTGMNSLNPIGNITYDKNYLPYGHDYGVGYTFNEQVNGYIVPKGGIIYALDKYGVVRGETSLNYLWQANIGTGSTSNYVMNINQCLADETGKIYFVAGVNYGVTPSAACWQTYDNFYNAMYCFVTNPLNTTLYDISKLNIVTTAQNTQPTAITGFLPISLLGEYIDGKMLRAHLLHLITIANPTLSITTIEQDGYILSTSTNVSGGATGSSAWLVGYRSNYRLIPDYQNNSPYWRIVGSLGINTLANYTNFGISPLPYDRYNFGSLTCGKTLTANTSTVSPGYGIASTQSSRISGAVVYDNTSLPINYSCPRLFYSIDGRLVPNYTFGYMTIPLANNKFINLTSSKQAMVMNCMNTANTKSPAYIYTFDTVNTSNTKSFSNGSIIMVGGNISPNANVSGNTLPTGSGYVNSYLTDKQTIRLYSDTINTSISATSGNDTAKITISLVDSSNNAFYLTPVTGQPYSTNITTQFRTTDGYLVANGQSILMKCDTDSSMAALLNVVEDI